MNSRVQKERVRTQWERLARPWQLALLVCAMGSAWSSPALTCGMVGGRLVPPKPADEQVLLVWDRATQTEHVVRQVRFSDAASRVGFLVPTPSKPTLHDIEAEPWDRLNVRCRPSWDGRGPAFGAAIGFGVGGLGHGAGAGFGSGLARGAAPKVLEERKLGDFTAFVLEATDAKGFAAWLKSNQFKTTPELTKWLGHYIGLKFYFTALRFDGKAAGVKAKGASAELTSKTVHISFKTANPYYPYLEPLPAAGAKPLAERKLQVWFLSDQLMQPVTRFSGDTKSGAPGSGGGGAAQGGELVRPWTEAYPCDGVLEDISQELEGELAKTVAAQKYIQVFADLKTSRAGYGDVLLHPLAASSCDAECQASRGQLVKLLEAANVQTAGTAPPSPEPYLAPRSCGVAAGAYGQRGPNSGAWLGALGLSLIWTARRRSRRVAAVERSAELAIWQWRVASGLLLLVAGLLLLACATERAAKPQATGHASQGAVVGSTSSASSAAPQAAPRPAASELQNTQPEPSLSLPAEASAARRALTDLLSGKLGAPQFPVHASDERLGLGGVDDVLPEGAPPIKDLQAKCLGTPGVEAVLRVYADYRDSQLVEARVVGPLSDVARKCIRAVLLATAPDAPADTAEFTRKFSIGLGGATPAQLALRRRFEFTRAVASAGPLYTYGSWVVTGGLPPEVVRRVMRSRFGMIRFCLKDAPASLTTVTLSFTIDADGHVKAGVRSKPNAGAAGACLRQRMEQATFPRPTSGEVKVSFEVKQRGPAKAQR